MCEILERWLGAGRIITLWCLYYGCGRERRKIGQGQSAPLCLVFPAGASLLGSGLALFWVGCWGPRIGIFHLRWDTTANQVSGDGNFAILRTLNLVSRSVLGSGCVACVRPCDPASCMLACDTDTCLLSRATAVNSQHA